jgi:ADP-ribosylation factor GTPase-activating protein 1
LKFPSTRQYTPQIKKNLAAPCVGLLERRRSSRHSYFGYFIYSWDDATIAERYSGEVGEEWKERLSAKVEGRQYVASAIPASSSMNFGGASNGSTGSRSQTPQSMRTDSPSRPPNNSVGGKARVDDRYFAGLGAANASRPADLPPSQGGKYAGFGSAPPEPFKSEAKLPGFDDLQRDPVAALTKGFGWFTTTVGKTAKNVNEGYIQPTAQKVCVSLPRLSSYWHICL